MMKKDRPIIYFDMDGVLVDFSSGIDALNLTKEEYHHHQLNHDFDEISGIFSLMKPTKGAIFAIKELVKHYDVRILTTAPWNNPSAWSDKLLWVKRYFNNTVESFPEGNPFYKRITITHRKDRVMGECLIDDNFAKNGAGSFVGDKIWFHLPDNAVAQCPENTKLIVAEFTNWYDVLNDLMPNTDTLWKLHEDELI